MQHSERSNVRLKSVQKGQVHAGRGYLIERVERAVGGDGRSDGAGAAKHARTAADCAGRVCALGGRPERARGVRKR